MVAREIDPPAGIKPLEWRLLNNRTETDFASAIQLIDGYRVRWETELLFLVVKNACRIEALQLSTLERLERLERVIGLYAGGCLAHRASDAAGADLSRLAVRPDL